MNSMFSKRLKELRIKKGVSQDNLADQLEIPRGTLSHWETDGSRSPRTNRLEKIATFFGVSVDYLLGRSDQKDLSESAEHVLYKETDLSAENLRKKYNLTLDGKPITNEEVEVLLQKVKEFRLQKLGEEYAKKNKLST